MKPKPIKIPVSSDYVTANIIGDLNKMAVSLCCRGVRFHHCDRIFRSFLRQSYFAFSTDDTETNSSDSLNNDANERDGPAWDSKRKTRLSSQQPVVDTQNIPRKSSKSSSVEGALDKFAKVVEKVKEIETRSRSICEKAVDPHENPNESFASMFRKSKMVSLGEHQGRRVEGRIMEVMDDDLYIDFGGKFHCVCQRPKHKADKYHRGAKVLLNLQSMEMSSAFLGSDIHVTLLEADAALLGLSSAGIQQRNRSAQS